MLDSKSTQYVFGLGLSRTGTTSLADGLNQLGVKTLHFPYDETTLAELRAGNYRLSVLDRFQGIVDITVAPFYAELDHNYSGCRFILTVRDKASWLASVERHWRFMLESWDVFDAQYKCFTEFIWACVYGTFDFSAERFSYVYDRHVTNVRDYFKGRNADLLVMNICRGDGWEQLCAFLDLPVPDVPFPRASATRKAEWTQKLRQLIAELKNLLPAGSTFILVDQQSFGLEMFDSLEAIPFLEKDGIYWGLPQNDVKAISELERLRTCGAKSIVFGWPAFWWFDYFQGLRQHLDANYPKTLANERLVVFDLR